MSLRLQIRYSKPSEFENGTPCLVYCDEPEASQVTIKVDGYYQEYTFRRNTFTGHNDRGQYQREGEWPLEKAWLLSMLQAAFDQGAGHQRVKIRDTLREVIGI